MSIITLSDLTRLLFVLVLAACMFALLLDVGQWQYGAWHIVGWPVFLVWATHQIRTNWKEDAE